MANELRYTKSRKELMIELSELRAALGALRRDRAHRPDDVHDSTARLAQLYAERIRRIESERASWIAWSPAARNRPDAQTVKTAGER
jgi:hypothetical protein